MIAIYSRGSVLPRMSSFSFSTVRFGKAKSYILGHCFMGTYGGDPGTGQGVLTLKNPSLAGFGSNLIQCYFSCESLEFDDNANISK